MTADWGYKGFPRQLTDPDRNPFPPKDESWRSEANCAGLPSSWFFPERGASIGESSEYEQAKAVCRACVCRQACLRYAMTEPIERWGLWGGLTARERGRLRGRRVV